MSTAKAKPTNDAMQGLLEKERIGCDKLGRDQTRRGHQIDRHLGIANHSLPHRKARNE